MDYSKAEYKLARSFLRNVLKVDEKIFDPKHIVYLENNCDVAIRGSRKHRYVRPSKCIKFELKASDSKHHKTNAGWDDYTWGYTYHGTTPNAQIVNSILKNGLQSSGKSGVQAQYGQKHGKGIYTTFIPFLAELYGGAVKYKGKWVRVLFKCRIDPDFKAKGGMTAKLS